MIIYYHFDGSHTVSRTKHPRDRDRDDRRLFLESVRVVELCDNGLIRVLKDRLGQAPRVLLEAVPPLTKVQA